MTWLLLASSALAAEGGNFLPDQTSFLDRGLSFVGIFILVGVAWGMSTNRARIDWRPVLWGIALQLVFGLLVLSNATAFLTFYLYAAIEGGLALFGIDWQVPKEGLLFVMVDSGVNRLIGFAGDGATFVFQSVQPHKILDPAGEPQFYVGTGNGISPPVKTFAFWILPTIIFFSSLMSLLYHVGVMQAVVRVLAWAMVRTLGTSGAESLSAAGNIFVGQTEAPLLIAPFVNKMTRSELMAVMTGGFATVAGGVLGAYVSFLKDVPNIAGHLVIASIISAPAALAIAKVMVPETEEPATRGHVEMPKVDPKDAPANAIEAAARGASDGMKLAINVAAMLIAIVGLVAMFDWIISWTPVTFCASGTRFGYSCAVAGEVGAPLSLSVLLGWVFAPVAFIMGVPWSECGVIGRLLGEKIVLTELLAYIHLGDVINGDVPQISQRSAIIASYALCGFANFASIGIQLGGIGGIAPDRMSDLAQLGVRAMIAGVIAACMTGCIAGLYL
ncbi:MAG: NupC/NupG family nucleoside CNT transporter [Alphaproteobacteria bacterium]|nr:NupC/NupG family nucleoside CNT transporter [Alphaproteobacteria bacterium]